MESDEEERSVEYNKMNTRTAFALKQNEAMVKCPYNTGHLIRTDNMQSHLFKCRRDHIKKLQDDKKLIQYRSCKHDPTHIVLNIELLFHEEHCATPSTLRAGAGTRHAIGGENMKMDLNAVLNKRLIRAAYTATYDPDLLTRDLYKHALEKSALLGKRGIAAENLDSFDREALENWDLQAKFCVAKDDYNPAEKMVHDLKLYVPAPPGLCKGERKKWQSNWSGILPRVYDPNDPDFALVDGNIIRYCSGAMLEEDDDW